MKNFFDKLNCSISFFTWAFVNVLLHHARPCVRMEVVVFLITMLRVLTSGVAYSKHIVHLYSYHNGDDLRNHLEVCVIHQYFGSCFEIFCNYFVVYFQCEGHLFLFYVEWIPYRFRILNRILWWNSAWLFRLRLMLVVLMILLSLIQTNFALSLVARTGSLRFVLLPH